MKVFRKIPQEVEVPVQIDADAARIAVPGRRRSAVLSPIGIRAHAVVPAIRIGLRKDVDVLVVDDVLNLTGGELLRSHADALLRSVGRGELLHEIDENVGASPLARVNAAKKIDSRPV